MPRRKQEQLSQFRVRQSRKDIGGVILLENFAYSTIFQRQDGADGKFLHRAIISPSYLYKIVNGSTIADLQDVSYPLMTPFPLETIPLTTGDGVVVSFYQPNIANDNRILYVATNSGKVKALSLTGVARNLGQPVSLTNNYDTTILTFTDKIFFINPTSTSIWHIPENTTGTTWTAVGGLNSPKFGITFSTSLYVADKNASGDANRRLVRVYNTGYVLQGSLDLGTTWDILDIVNNNNKFILIFAQPVGTSANQYAFLWDGSYQNRYFHAIKLPGKYVGSVNYMGAFLIFLQVGADLKIYELAGYALNFIDSLPSIKVNEKCLPSQRFTVYGNYVCFPVFLKDLDLKAILMYNILEKEAVLIKGETSEIIATAVNSDLNGNIRIFYSDDVADRIKTSIIFPSGALDDYTGNFKVITDELIYISNRITFFNRVSIDKVEVWYGNKPANATDRIKINFQGIDTRLNTTDTVDLIINQDSQSNYVLFDAVGVRGDQIQVRIYTTNSATFRTTLKRMLIYYSNL
ncbi:MAG: hypothetical protein KatS3mg096_739 [Candidatus Parcubacteria bacterium]|nr:MAG: hypothetical protein KatS3mg096_739 [Candidatus Parcubacteria bacterium]